MESQTDNVINLSDRFSREGILRAKFRGMDLEQLSVHAEAIVKTLIGYQDEINAISRRMELCGGEFNEIMDYVKLFETNKSEGLA